MFVQPYLFFDGRCQEALDFYAQAVGAKLDMKMLFKDSPDPATCQNMPPGAAEKVMHASFRIGDSLIMASDGMCGGKPNFQGVSLSITADTIADADRLFAALGDGGHVQMPMTETFFSPRFGMVADKFGVSWMVIVGK